MASWLDRMTSPLREAGAETTLDEVVREAAEGDPRAHELATTFELVLGVGRALLGFGLPAQRLEEALERLATALGFALDCYSTPTASGARPRAPSHSGTTTTSTSSGPSSARRCRATSAASSRSRSSRVC